MSGRTGGQDGAKEEAVQVSNEAVGASATEDAETTTDKDRRTC